MPETLDWDLWLGPAPQRPYHPAYLPFRWRGWWDFGTGALGDIGCHAFDPVFRALKLGPPTERASQLHPCERGDLPAGLDGHLRVSGPRRYAPAEANLVRRRTAAAAAGGARRGPADG